jgi:hypothetical protein
MTLSVFVKGKVDFKYVKIPNMTLSMFVKKKLTLDISKYNFEYICQKKN